MKTIQWFKVNCSFYEREFGIKKWSDVISFMEKYVGFDISITAQYTEPFEGVDGFYENGSFYII